jgi:deoxyribodipyrimidine photo-lyase
MTQPAESFLDELITWREIGYNMAAHLPGYTKFSSLPDWAKKTIAEHRDDARPDIYELDQFENADTHDEIWNAAQRELVTDGRMHNYLRMLWGKKIYEWSPDAETALEVMVHLNNKYAVDGRDPNSYSGIFWCLGRYDRAWGPERPIFGKLRYMTSDSTRRKMKLERYLERYGKQASLF